MLETAIVLIVGFALGYGVREWLSRRRRQAERRRREAFASLPKTKILAWTSMISLRFITAHAQRLYPDKTSDAAFASGFSPGTTGTICS